MINQIKVDQNVFSMTLNEKQNLPEQIYLSLRSFISDDSLLELSDDKVAASNSSSLKRMSNLSIDSSFQKVKEISSSFQSNSSH